MTSKIATDMAATTCFEFSFTVNQRSAYTGRFLKSLMTGRRNNRKSQGSFQVAAKLQTGSTHLVEWLTLSDLTTASGDPPESSKNSVRRTFDNQSLTENSHIQLQRALREREV